MTPASPRRGCYTQMRAPYACRCDRATANTPRDRDRPTTRHPPQAAPGGDPSWRSWAPVSPYLAKDPRPDLSQGMSLKAVEEIEARAQEAQKYALEGRVAPPAGPAGVQGGGGHRAQGPRDDGDGGGKEAERAAAEAKEVEEGAQGRLRPARRRARTRAPWPTRATPRSEFLSLSLPVLSCGVSPGVYGVRKNRTAASILMGTPSSISASLLHSWSMISNVMSASGPWPAMPSIARRSSSAVR